MPLLDFLLQQLLIFFLTLIGFEFFYYHKNHKKGTQRYLKNTIVLFSTLLWAGLVAAYQILNHVLERKNRRFDYCEAIYDNKTNGVIVYLIHGTFEPDAEWVTNDDSEIRQEIIKSIDTPITFCKIKWSGQNHFLARESATNLLVEEIKKNNQENLDQYIVAHSHGGNIALSALRALGGRENSRIKKIALLSTPVINITRRKVDKFTQIAHLMTPSVFAFFLLFFTLLTINAISTTIELVYIFDISLLFTLIVMLATRKLRVKYEKTASSIYFSSIKGKYRAKTNTMFFTSLGDEAHAALSVASALSEAGSSLMNSASEALEIRSNRTSSSVSPWVGIIPLFYVLLAAISPNQNHKILMQGISCVLFFTIFEKNIISFNMFFINFFTSISFSIHNFNSAFAFGYPSLSLFSEYSIYSSDTPKGRWIKYTEEKHGRGLSHSTHSSPIVIRKVGEFIKKSGYRKHN